MIINEEPVLVAIQQSTQMIEETLATNMRRFKGGPHSKRRHHDTRRSKRSPRETGGDGNSSFNFQNKFYNNNNHNNSYYRNFNGAEKSGPQFQYPFNPLNVQQSFQQDPFQYQHQTQQQLQQPTSPLRITPPMPSSSHPLSSFQTPYHQQQQPQQPISTPSNGQPVYMYQSQVQMPLPMQYPMPIPVSMPPVNYDGSPVAPLQMPLHMPNMPLPVFIRLPAQPCMSPVSSGNTEDNLKSSASSASLSSLSTTTTTTTTSTSNQPPPPPAAVVNFIPLLFPSHLGPMLFGPSQQIMVAPMSRTPNHFNQMVNDNGQQLYQKTPSAPQHQQHQSSAKSI